jgi:hypothetical protein
VGSGQNPIEVFEACDQEAYNERRGTKENCGCATKEIGAAEGEEGRLNDDAARVISEVSVKGADPGITSSRILTGPNSTALVSHSTRLVGQTGSKRRFGRNAIGSRGYPAAVSQGKVTLTARV